MSDPISVSFVRDPSVSDSRIGEATGSVTYRSAGACLIIGELDAALDALASLPALSCSVFVMDELAERPGKRLLETGVAVFDGGTLVVSGHLGNFTAVAGTRGTRTQTGAEDGGMDLALSAHCENDRFDLVLDLGAESLFAQRLPPFGYAHVPPGTEPQRAREAIAALDELVGEFDKPRYFRYDADICAHSRSSLAGCTRCLDVCTTAAISASGDGVTVDPWLCQGCGSCATVCPTGAMSYAYPTVPEAVERTRQASSTKVTETLVLYAEADQAVIDGMTLPDTVLDLVVEEVSAFGLDYWLTCLAGGIARIVLVSDASPDDPNRQALQEQSELLHRLLGELDGLSDAQPLIHLVEPDRLLELLGKPLPKSPTGGQGAVAFTVNDDKRGTIRLALDLLAERYAPTQAVLDLPPGAPFGRIAVDDAACTLCMACVSTCPAGALLDGQDVPALRLIEANCVQCGLCEQACPEDAITLQSRYVWDSVEARRTVTLHEEQPFHCVRCHKAFATRRMIETMSAKLADHWMFAEPAALKRLKMCEDCRVKDLFEHEPGGLDVHRGAAARDGGDS